MTFCGYNQKIGDGLALLFEGMADSLTKKASKDSNIRVLKRENIELESMIEVFKTAPSDVLAQMFSGLNSMALPMFTLVLEELKTDSSKDLREVCMEIGYSFISLLSRTEKQNETMALSEWDEKVIANRARELASWVVSQNKQQSVKIKIAANDHL